MPLRSSGEPREEAPALIGAAIELPFESLEAHGIPGPIEMSA
jgi:hypothetical protein